MFGDDCGFIHILYFKNPISSLFDPVRRKVDPTRSDKTAANSTQRIFWDVSLYISMTRIEFHSFDFDQS